MATVHTYNSVYFDGTTLKQLSPKRDAFSTQTLSDGTVIGLFQGKNHAFDFILRALFPGADKRPVPPPHMFWVVDLLLKIPEHRADVREILVFYIDFYQNTQPFASISERDSYKLTTVSTMAAKYAHIEQGFTLPLDYVATVLELFSKNEKLNPRAFRFINLLETTLGYVDNERHFTEVLKAAERGR